MSGTGTAGTKACKIVFSLAAPPFPVTVDSGEPTGIDREEMTMFRLRRILGHVVSGFATAGMCVSGFTVAES